MLRTKLTLESSNDELEVVADPDGATITIENPWAGGTETGFGSTTTIRLNWDQAVELGGWLINNLKVMALNLEKGEVK